MAGAVQLSWLQLGLVALGGALGSVARFLGSGAVHRLFPGLAFPVGTLAVNVAGSLVIGLVGGLAEGRQFLVPDLRVFLLTGVLGGFTHVLGLRLRVARPRPRRRLDAPGAERHGAAAARARCRLGGLRDRPRPLIACSARGGELVQVAQLAGR
jgi:protein CrcB